MKKLGIQISEDVNYKGVVINYVVEQETSGQWDDTWMKEIYKSTSLEKCEEFVDSLLSGLSEKRVIKTY